MVPAINYMADCLVQTHEDRNVHYHVSRYLAMEKDSIEYSNLTFGPLWTTRHHFARQWVQTAHTSTIQAFLLL